MTGNISDELKFIVELMDDPDQAVCRSIDRRISEIGPECIGELQKILRQEKEKGRIRILNGNIFRYNSEFCLKELESLKRRGGMSLCEVACVIATLTAPGLTHEEFYSTMTPLISEVMLEVSEQKTAMENVNLLNHIFYHRFNFSPCDPFMSVEENALLWNVIQSRKGNPIAVSVIYFILAEACGVPIRPFCFPGGFVPVYQENGKPLFFINIFQHGEILMANQISDFMKMQGLDLPLEQCQTKEPLTVMTLYLETLAAYYSNYKEVKIVEAIEKALAILGGERFMSVDEDDL